MKKTLMILTLISVSLFVTSAQAAGYKVCYFHDVEYAYIPEFNTCPWNASNLPPEADDFPPGPHHITISKNIHSANTDNKKNNEDAHLLVVIVHSPECFGEHGGMMN